MTTYPSTLLIIMTVTLLYPSTLMLEPLKKSKNQTEVTYLPMLPQNQLVNTHYQNTLPTVTCCPGNANQCIPTLKKTVFGNVFGASIADLSSTPLVHHYIDTSNAKPVKQRAYHASHHHRQKIEKQVEEMLCNSIIEPIVSPWTSPVMLVTKADSTLQLCVDHQNLIKPP